MEFHHQSFRIFKWSELRPRKKYKNVFSLKFYQRVKTGPFQSYRKIRFRPPIAFPFYYTKGYIYKVLRFMTRKANIEGVVEKNDHFVFYIPRSTAVIKEVKKKREKRTSWSFFLDCLLYKNGQKKKYGSCAKFFFFSFSPILKYIPIKTVPLQLIYCWRHTSFLRIFISSILLTKKVFELKKRINIRWT